MENIENNTIGVQGEGTVASTGTNESHSTNAVGVDGTAVNNPAPTQVTSEYSPGPDQVLANYRRELEQAKSELETAKAQLENPEVARFLAYQKAQKEEAAAKAAGVSPEVLNQLNEISQSQAQLVEARNLDAARSGFARFAESQNMNEVTQGQFLNYVESVLPPAMQDLALKPGFNFEPYIHGFAAKMGAQAKTAEAVKQTEVTYVPGQPSGNPAANAEDEMKKYIQNRVKNG